MITGLITFRNAGSNKLYTSHIAGSATANHNADGIRFEMNAGNVVSTSQSRNPKAHLRSIHHQHLPQ